MQYGNIAMCKMFCVVLPDSENVRNIEFVVVAHWRFYPISSLK